ncbi:diadenylate cyclase [Aminobacter aminovorans]|uniref:DAC domain-containing protein n=1 Tax=Aminobacter aminovorans TaxID=83263 RepID=A0AAC8YRQ6_AMIAI|nr:diadenylate cyclase [Aminobacter aminovorans]AMS43252.1 hypothetical protein AA2016_4337 [Aminobacter aminovorans]MBB3706198.1 hypothetical protein [Aminobacter aminovorans]
MRHTINLFMWGYQSHFRLSLEHLARRVFELIGAEIEPKVLLVGLRRADLSTGHPVCIEPEDGEWPLTLLDRIVDEVNEAIPNHPMQRMFYGDDISMREKPDNIRRLTITEQVQRRLDVEGRKQGRRTFCSQPYRVSDYDVVCTLQVPEYLFRQYPAFVTIWNGEPNEASFVHSCINQILKEGRRGLMQPDPGRQIADDAMRSAPEVIRRAAARFMATPFIEGRFAGCDMFDAINAVSQAQYEGEAGAGRLIFASANDPNLSFVLKFDRPAALTQTRWARKLLQMSTSEAALIADYNSIVGLGDLSDDSTPPFAVDFLGHDQWDFRQGDQVLMRWRFGHARLPQETIGKERFIDNMRRVFVSINDDEIGRFRAALDILTQLRHGSSLVIASDAADEAKRLQRQGTVITPTPLSKALIEHATLIDGTILADKNGICHAIGVILDGTDSLESTPSRGSRYNSAVRYVAAASVPRMAFIVSEDRTLDVVPLLRPSVDRNKIEQAVANIASATKLTYHKLRSFLDDHRFYLNEEQCLIVNEALDRIAAEPREMGEISIVTPRFKPHPAFNESYLKD